MTACNAHTDQQLFKLIARDDEQAFHIFFGRYRLKVYHFILHIIRQESLAEELTQDVFLKLWMGRAMLDAVINPGNYLFVIAKNRSLDQLAQNARTRNLQHALQQQIPRQVNTTEEEVSYRESSEMIAYAVQELPEQQRTVYYLSKEKGLSRNQIASILHISPHTVKNHLGVALDSIRRHLQRNGKTALLALLFLLR